MEKRSSAKMSTKKLCILAMLIALFVVLDYYATIFSIGLGGGIKISFSGLPVILASMLFGPIAGMVVGLLGSFTGQMLTYGFGPTTLLWILPAGIRGLSMGLLFSAFGKSIKFRHLIIEIVISSLLVTAANTLVIYLDSVILGYFSMEVVFGMLVARLISALITAVVYSAIVLFVYRPVKKFV